MPERIQLSRAKGWRMPKNTVKVDRTTKWGNPYRVEDYYDVGCCGSIEAAQKRCVDAFRALADGQHRRAHGIPEEHTVPDLAPLRGKNLACWCKLGTPCHADVLLDLANAPREDVTP